MSKFTQGKWKADDFAIYIFSEDEKMTIAQIRGWGYLTGKGSGGMGLSDEEAYSIQEANARLIAAAPEMYELLQDAAEELTFVESESSEELIEKILALSDRINGKKTT